MSTSTKKAQVSATAPVTVADLEARIQKAPETPAVTVVAEQEPVEPVVANHVSNLSVDDEVVLWSGKKREIKKVTYVGEKNMKVGSYIFNRDNGYGTGQASGKKITCVTPELRQKLQDEAEAAELRNEANFLAQSFVDSVAELPLAELKEAVEFMRKHANA